jgi:ATP-dependent Clp protease protease subunit
MITIKGVIGDDYPYVKWLSDLKAETSPALEVLITSPGGFVEDGLNMFMDLMEAAQAGRRVITRSAGECASIASIVFMAGTERIAGCPLMIHNPWTVAQGDADSMEGAVKELRAVEKQLEEIYAERSGLAREKVSALMDRETWIPPAEAVALGFATSVDATVTNLLNKLKNQKMSNKQTVGERLRAFFAGKKNQNEPSGEDPKAQLVLETTDGQTLTVEREEGEPQVGDAATPDGTFPVTETRTIVVAGGVITEIIDTAASPGEEVTEALLDEIERLTKEVANLKARAKTEEEVRVLNVVKMAGGIAKLVDKAGIRSSYLPPQRANRETNPVGNAMRERIAKEREKYNAKINK